MKIVGYYSPGDRVVFDCYVERGEDEEDVVNTFNDITSPYVISFHAPERPPDTLESSYWDYNSYGYFPEAYVEVVCAGKTSTSIPASYSRILTSLCLAL